MIKARTMMAALFAMTVLVSVATGPVGAQQQQQGLVNVAVGDIKTGDIISNNNVELAAAANVAASVCGATVNAAVISNQLARTGNFNCEGATQFVRVKQAAKQ